MSKIEWTDATWNPLTGCTRVSEGCRNCYAERMSARLANMGQDKYLGVIQGAPGVRLSIAPKWTGDIFFHPETLAAPLRWRKPRRVFVNSMSDTFHPGVTDEQIAAIFGVMAECPDHTFQVLTKRPERAAEWFRGGSDPDLMFSDANRNMVELKAGFPKPFTWPLPNVWLGTSVEDQATADERIPHLLNCPAAIRFVSYEPALGPVSFRWAKWHDYWPEGWRKRGEPQGHLDGMIGLHWVIAGGESGPGARPAQSWWFQQVRDQCLEAGVSFFFKQWGEWAPRDEDTMLRVGKKAAGRMLDGREWSEWPA